MTRTRFATIAAVLILAAGLVYYWFDSADLNESAANVSDSSLATDSDVRAYDLHSARTPKYSLAWYGYHLDVYYFPRRAAHDNPAFEAHADTMLRIARSNDEFRTLRALGPDGERMYRMFMAIR